MSRCVMENLIASILEIYVPRAAKRYSSNATVVLKETSWNEEWNELIDEWKKLSCACY